MAMTSTLEELLLLHTSYTTVEQLRCRCETWSTKRGTGASKRHAEHLAEMVTDFASTPAGNVANINDLRYAANALNVSSDNGDRYCARRLMNLADRLTLEVISST